MNHYKSSPTGARGVLPMHGVSSIPPRRKVPGFICRRAGRGGGRRLLLAGLCAALAIASGRAAANTPGAVSASDTDVTVKDNNDGTVTMGNGIVSIVIVKKTSRLNSVMYTHHNNGTAQTTETMLGKGQYYYGGFSLGSGEFEYTLASNPAENGGNYADVKLLSTSANNGVMETHFSMLRGSSGYYSTATMTHRAQDAKFEVSAWGVVTRVKPAFNWLSADAWRNFLIGVPTKGGAKVPNSPHEITVNLNGSQQGEYADKFIYGQDHADLRAWGWSSVGKEGLNIGIWMTTNMDFSNGGPFKRDVSVYPYSELNNSILTGELGQGSDGKLADGEIWTKTAGPFFIYLNSVPAAITDPNEAAQALFKDAQAQAAAEKQAWPYPWFKNPAFVPASGRGVVNGKFVIADPGNPNATGAGLWVGLEQQPITSTGTYDFQKWLKPYQYWVQTDATGNFSIPNVIAGSNYTLYAFGPGAAGTFISQNQKDGNPPLELDLPAKPFAVEVKPGEATTLGAVTWTPKRIGATVFEMGSPTRKADEFRHSEDFWLPGTSPKLGYPTPVWGGQMEYVLDFPNGMVFNVGKSRWATDWNYVLPSEPDAAGVYQPCTGTINFTLAQAPADAAQASIYLACAGDDGGKVIVSLNGKNLGAASGVTAAPDPISEEGFNPAYFDDASIHFGNHGPFSDERITFPASLLRAGQNTLTIQMDARSLVTYLMVDYLRLELTGYVPPPPASVSAFAGNNQALVCWPVVPGATSYDLVRSTAPGAGYVPVASGFVGPVSGSGANFVAYRDATAANGTRYYYEVRSANPGGRSAFSPPNAGVTPAPTFPMGAPVAPAGLRVVASGHHRVALNWGPSSGASYYSVYRTTLCKNGVGGTYPLRTILLEDAAAATSYVDDSPTDGRIYSYDVSAVGVAGTSPRSAAVTAIPLPAPPASAPGSLAGHWTKNRNGDAITLSWSPVPGAAGYVIYRIAGPGSTFAWPTNFLTALAPATYTDQGITDKNAPVKGLNKTIEYSYQVTAVNAGGISSSSSVKVMPPTGAISGKR